MLEEKGFKNMPFNKLKNLLDEKGFVLNDSKKEPEPESLGVPLANKETLKKQAEAETKEKAKKIKEDIKEKVEQLFGPLDFSKAFKGTDNEKKEKIQKSLDKVSKSIYKKIFSQGNFDVDITDEYIFSVCLDELNKNSFGNKTIEKIILEKCSEAKELIASKSEQLVKENKEEGSQARKDVVDFLAQKVDNILIKNKISVEKGEHIAIAEEILNGEGKNILSNFEKGRNKKKNWVMNLKNREALVNFARKYIAEKYSVSEKKNEASRVGVAHVDVHEIIGKKKFGKKINNNENNNKEVNKNVEIENDKQDLKNLESVSVKKIEEVDEKKGEEKIFANNNEKSEAKKEFDAVGKEEKEGKEDERENEDINKDKYNSFENIAENEKKQEAEYEFFNDDERKKVFNIDRQIESLENEIKSAKERLKIINDNEERKAKIEKLIAMNEETIDRLKKKREDIFETARRRAGSIGQEDAGADDTSKESDEKITQEQGNQKQNEVERKNVRLEDRENDKFDQKKIDYKNREAELMARFELLDNELHGRPIRDEHGRVIGREGGLMGEYVRKDYEMDKKSSIQAWANYEAKMKEYKSVMLELMGDKEGAEITSDWIEKGEYLNLKNMHMNVKMENSPWSEKIKGYALKLAEDYRKLPLWKKLVISGTLAGVGFVGGAIGGVAAGGSALLIGGMRIFSTGVSAVGFKGIYEGIAEKSRNKKAEAETKENMLWGASGPGPDGGFDLSRVNEILDQKIGRMDSEFQSRKDWSKRRTWMAIGSALAVTAIGHYVGHKFFDYLKGGTHVAGGVHSGINHIPDNLRDINIPKGSSFEGALSKHLQLMGMNAEEAGKKAHLMALDYAQEHGLEKGPYSLVHEGAKIQLSPDGTKVIGIRDAQGLGWLKEHIATPNSHTPIQKTMPIGSTEIHSWELGRGNHPNVSGKDYSGYLNRPATFTETPAVSTEYNAKMDRILNDIDSQLDNQQHETVMSYTHSSEDMARIAENMEDLNKAGSFVENLQHAINGDYVNEITSNADAVKSVILQSIVEDRANLSDFMRSTFDEVSPNGTPLVSGLDWRTEDNLQRVITYVREIGGNSVVPQPGEKVVFWLERVSNILINKK